MNRFLFLLLTGLTTGILLLLAMVPGLYWGESSLITMRAWHFGSAHPSGYPLFLHLIHLAEKTLCLGDISFRANLVGILLMASASMLFCRLLLELEVSASISLISSVCFFLSLPCMSASAAVEVYSLHLVFILIVLNISSSSIVKDSKLYLLVFTCSLALTHHLTFSLLIPGLFISLLSRRMIQWKPTQFATVVGLLIFGLSIYIYLPLRESISSCMVWGKSDTLGGFVTLITAHEEARGSLLSGLSGGTKILDRFFLVNKILYSTLYLPGLALIVPGMLRLNQTASHVLKLTVIWFFSITVPVLMYDSNETSLFFLPALLIFWLWATVGFSSAVFSFQHSKYRWFNQGKQMLSIIPLLLLIVTIQHFFQYRHNDVFVPGTLAKAALDLVGDETTIVTRRSDWSFINWYFQVIEKRNPNHVIYQHLLSFKWYYSDLVEKNVLNEDLENARFEDSQSWNAAVTASLVHQNLAKGKVLLAEPEILADILRAGWQPSQLDCTIHGVLLSNTGANVDCSKDPPGMMGRLDALSTQALGAFWTRHAQCLSMAGSSEQASKAVSEARKYYLLGIQRDWWD